MRTRKASDIASKGQGAVLLALAVLAAVIAVAAQAAGFFVAGTLGLPAESVQSALVAELCGAIPAVVFMVVGGGASWAAPSGGDIRYAFRFAWFYLAVSVGITVVSLAWMALSGTSLCEGWISRLAFAVPACLAIGVFEEFTFRGLVFNGLMSVLGERGSGPLWAALVTSAFFAIAHLSLPVAESGLPGLLPSLLKMVQMFMYSVVLCAVVIHTRRLGGVSLFHALDDLILVIPGVVLLDMPMGQTLVPSGGDAVSIVCHLVIVALYLPVFVKALRSLGSTDE